MIELKPIRETPSDYDEIEAEIALLFKKEIYEPIAEELAGTSKRVFRNSLDELAEAIRSSRISFQRGRFTGKFTAAISKELRKLGAKWDRSTQSYQIASSKLPLEILTQISLSESTFDGVIRRIDRKLAAIEPAEIAGKIRLEKLFDKSLWKVDGELNKTMKAITVVPRLTPSRAKLIAEEYTNNMKLYIQEWTQKAIKELRQKMSDRVYKGLRYEGVIKQIQESYNVSKRKAKFLARQETSLMMTSFKQERYRESGIKQYRWRCVVGTVAHPVRPMHKKLDGKTFSFDDPPVTSPDGARNNPGRDYNCRCVAVPLVKFG